MQLWTVCQGKTIFENKHKILIWECMKELYNHYIRHDIYSQLRNNNYLDFFPELHLYWCNNDKVDSSSKHQTQIYLYFEIFILNKFKFY